MAGAAGLLNKRVSKPLTGMSTGAAAKRGRENWGKAKYGDLNLPGKGGAAVNRRMAGLASGWQGRFGFGERGKEAIAQRQGKAAREGGGSDKMKDLAMHDANAVLVHAMSGGTREGADAAVAKLKQWNPGVDWDAARRTAEVGAGKFSPQNTRSASQVPELSRAISDSELDPKEAFEALKESAGAVSVDGGKKIMDGIGYQAKQNSEVMVASGGDVNKAFKSFSAKQMTELPNPNAIKQLIAAVHKEVASGGSSAKLDALKAEIDKDNSQATETTRKLIEEAINNQHNPAWRPS